MLIDCDECVMQHTKACEDCLATVLLDASPTRAATAVELDDQEAAAVEQLAELGLVPRLRLVSRNYRPNSDDLAKDESGDRAHPDPAHPQSGRTSAGQRDEGRQGGGGGPNRYRRKPLSVWQVYRCHHQDEPGNRGSQGSQRDDPGDLEPGDPSLR